MHLPIDSSYDFKRQFNHIGKGNEFTYEGFEALYQYFVDLEDDVNPTCEDSPGIAIVPADICVLWHEVNNNHFLTMYTDLTECEASRLTNDERDDRIMQITHNEGRPELFLRTTMTVLIGSNE